VLGETIWQLRTGKGWSILQLSKRSGVPEQIILEIESGRPYVPSEGNTVLLAEALSASVGLLLGERERLCERWYR
jgi:transcriptional regulator with XRE-family HTH domain